MVDADAIAYMVWVVLLVTLIILFNTTIPPFAAPAPCFSQVLTVPKSNTIHEVPVVNVPEILTNQVPVGTVTVAVVPAKGAIAVPTAKLPVLELTVLLKTCVKPIVFPIHPVVGISV